MGEARIRSSCRLGIGYQSGQLRAGYQEGVGTVTQRNFVTPQYAVVYMVRGHGHAIDGQGQRWELSPGCVLQRRPGEAHHFETHDPAWYFLAVPAPCYESLRITGLRSLDTMVFNPGLDPGLRAGCEAMIDELGRCPATQLAACNAQILQLIVRFHLRGAERHEAGREDSFARTACRALERSCDGRRPLEAIAHELGLGYAAFRKRFTNALGIAPGTYRIRARIERAQSLLSDPVLSIEAIADDLGYADIFAFSAQFKRHTGHSPSTFRKAMG
ncbi:MAG: AraC family transcriptional regulator [Planctomycetota bacterium]|nr:AraC family transcriptional regulator [Planctomycetota bacterium]